MRSSVPVRRIACRWFSSAATLWALWTSAVPLTANSQEAAVTELMGPRPRHGMANVGCSGAALREPTCPPCVGPRSEPRASRLSRYLYHCFTTWFTCNRKIHLNPTIVYHFVVPYAHACQAAVHRRTLRAHGDVCLMKCRAVQGRAGQCRAVQGSAGQGRAGQCRAVQGRAGQCRAVQGSAGQGSAGQCRAGQGRAGQGRAGQGSASRQAMQCAAAVAQCIHSVSGAGHWSVDCLRRDQLADDGKAVILEEPAQTRSERSYSTIQPQRALAHWIARASALVALVQSDRVYSAPVKDIAIPVADSPTGRRSLAELRREVVEEHRHLHGGPKT